MIAKMKEDIVSVVEERALIAEARKTQGYSEGDLRSLVRSLANALEVALSTQPAVSVVDDARAEAHRRYEPSKLIEDYDGDRYVDDDWGYDECQRSAFIEGAVWQASRGATERGDNTHE